MRLFVLFGKLFLFKVLCGANRERYLRLRALIARLAGRLGIYEQRNIRLLGSWVKPGAVVVDAGASYGIYTAKLAGLVAERGKVFAFEPLPFVFERLAAKQPRQVHCFNFGLSEEARTTSMKLPLLFGVVPEPALATVETTPYVFETISAELKPLDAFIEDLQGLTFIKADVEGHEGALLKGASETIRRYRPIIQIESNTSAALTELRTFCEQNDYTLYGLRRGSIREIAPGKTPNGPNVYLLPSEIRDGSAL